MIKKLASRVREYRKQAIATPLFMVGEVAMEALIPMIMALLIDRGIGTDEQPGSIGQILAEPAARYVLPDPGLLLFEHR